MLSSAYKSLIKGRTEAKQQHLRLLPLRKALFRCTPLYTNSMSLTNQQILYKQIDEILWYEWDPIGVNEFEEARDEYTGYLPQVWRLKLQNVNMETIAQYLFKIETENMGLFGNIDNCRKVANKIVGL